jgi:hypothetical protein
MTLPRTALAALFLLCSACGPSADDSTREAPEAVDGTIEAPVDPAPSAEEASGPGTEAASGAEGDAAATEEDASATAGASATDGDAAATDGDAAATDGDAAATDGDAAATDGEDAAETEDTAAIAAEAPAVTADPTPAPSGKKALACPGIDSATSALIQAQDRAAIAKAHGMSLIDGRVRVIAELAAADADLEGPVEEELRAGTNAQVLIQPDSICEFAATKGVKRVRKPAAPRPK